MTSMTSSIAYTLRSQPAWLAACVALYGFALAPIAQAVCNDAPISLQVLGSGGPFGNGRASAGYLVWIDGSARIMVDAGGGTFTRFHEASARVDDLELLALSHLHPDHSAEVPALLWIKPTDMLVSGPTGSGDYPSIEQYVSGLFGPAGVFRSVTNGEGMRTLTIDVDRSTPTEVFANNNFQVHGIGVPHGVVPAVGYRVDVGDASIAFSSDQNASDPAFAEFARGVDVLVIHFAIPESQTGFGADLHARPSAWGKLATDADIGTLVLSHLSGIAPKNADGSVAGLDEKLEHLRTRYDGPVIVAEDLLCVPIGSR